MRPINVLSMILAGGVGERLYPLTANRCKPVVPFGGNFRIIDFTLMNCVCSNLRRIHVLPQYHAQSLSRHAVERWSFLSRELGEYVELLPPKMRAAKGFYQGTADAIFRNLDLLDRYRPDVVLVLSGDHVYRADYHRFIEAHLEREADITVLSDWVDASECSAFGVLTLDKAGRINGFVEKPADPSPYAIDGRCATNLGVYCFQTDFLVKQLIRDAKKLTPHDFGRNILPAAVGKARVLSCPIEVISPDPQPYWRDVGNIDSYFQANMDLLAPNPPFMLADRRWSPDSRFHEWVPALCSTSARIRGKTVRGRNIISSAVTIDGGQVVNSVLSSRVRIDGSAEVEDCILFEGVEIGRGSKLRRVIVEEGVRIPPGAQIGFGDDDSREFTISPKGITVVAASYRFPGGDERGSRTASCEESTSASEGSREDAAPADEALEPPLFDRSRVAPSAR